MPLLSERVVQHYQENIAPLTATIMTSLDDWLNDVSEDVVIYAIDEACKHNKRNYKYIEAIIRNHFNAGRTTLAQVQDAQKCFKNKNGGLEFNNDSGLDYDELEKIMQEKM